MMLVSICLGRPPPRKDKIQIMAAVLGVSDAWLAGYDVRMLSNTVADTSGWHIAAASKSPEPNKHGFWCKTNDGMYDRLWYEHGFFHAYGALKVYVPEDYVIAWQPLTEFE